MYVQSGGRGKRESGFVAGFLFSFCCWCRLYGEEEHQRLLTSASALRLHKCQVGGEEAQPTSSPSLRSRLQRINAASRSGKPSICVAQQPQRQLQHPNKAHRLHLRHERSFTCANTYKKHSGSRKERGRHTSQQAKHAHTNEEERGEQDNGDQRRTWNNRNENGEKKRSGEGEKKEETPGAKPSPRATTNREPRARERNPCRVNCIRCLFYPFRIARLTAMTW